MDHIPGSTPSRDDLLSDTVRVRDRLNELISSLSAEGGVTADYCQSVAPQLRVLGREIDRFAGHCPLAPVPTEGTLGKVFVFPGQQR